MNVCKLLVVGRLFTCVIPLGEPVCWLSTTTSTPICPHIIPALDDVAKVGLGLGLFMVDPLLILEPCLVKGENWLRSHMSVCVRAQKAGDSQ